MPMLNWRRRIGGAWESWEAVVEGARGRNDIEVRLQFPAEVEGDETDWIEDPSSWICKQRGLGTFARIALARYLGVPASKAKKDKSGAVALPRKTWSSLMAQFDPHQADIMGRRLDEFDRQLKRERYAKRRPLDVSGCVKRLSVLVDDDNVWALLARVANLSNLLRVLPQTPEFHDLRQRLQRPGLTDADLCDALTQVQTPLQLVSGATLRHQRFSGPTAVTDFIEYLNTGIVPEWQPPVPDGLADLGVHAGCGRRAAFAPSCPREKRGEVIEKLARYHCGLLSTLKSPKAPRLARASATFPGAPKRPELNLRIGCLSSSHQPEDLTAACEEVIAQYVQLCIDHRRRRLPIVYVPVGLDASARFVSRQAVVRDLHKKLCIDRVMRREDEDEPHPLPWDATSEQIDVAIDAIRKALAEIPTFLVFGVYHVQAQLIDRPVEAEILDSPLPFIFSRMMPETGTFEKLVPPEQAYATCALILADGVLEEIANLPCECLELPTPPLESCADLLAWGGYTRVRAFREARRLPDIASNEVDLAILETALSLTDNTDFRQECRRLVKELQQTWTDNAGNAGSYGTDRLVKAVLDHLAARALVDARYAWFMTILQILALVQGGIRFDTAARILAGYIVATSASVADERPRWSKAIEVTLWRPTSSASRLSEKEVAALSTRIVRYLRLFASAAKDHVLRLSSARTVGLDEHAHPYESLEVPTFIFEFQDPKNLLRLKYSQVQYCLRKQMIERFPEKSALLQRLLAEEFIRRTAIVRRHGSDHNPLSLVDRRYCIAAIHHGLASLTFSRDPLLSEEGRRRCRWFMKPSSRTAAYNWIYEWLYVSQLNLGGQALSRQNGAELLKFALIVKFLKAEPNRFRSAGQIALREFMVRRELYEGLVHVGIRVSNWLITVRAMRWLESLTKSIVAAIHEPAAALSPELRAAWLREIGRAQREIVKLKLDGAVTYGLAFTSQRPEASSWRTNTLIRSAFDALADPGCRKVDLSRIIQEIRGVVIENQDRNPPFIGLEQAARSVRQHVPNTAQAFYDYLLRYAELIANDAERLAERGIRLRRQRDALLMFELAEALRAGYVSAGPDARMLQMSPRPIRNACRLCLAVGKGVHKMDQENRRVPAVSGDPSWYFERAEYYAFHFTGDHSRHPLERIASLIIEASVIRIRSSLANQPRFELALCVLKTAERGLIHYPSRVQLWMRFYLERARLFRDRAVQLGASGALETARCVQYCELDIASLRRLAGERHLWVERGERVLDTLPFRHPRGESGSLFNATESRPPKERAAMTGGPGLQQRPVSLV